MAEKITISTAEVYAPDVDNRMKTREAAARTASHYQQQSGPPPIGSQVANAPASRGLLFPLLWGAAGGFVGWLFGDPMFSAAEASREPRGVAAIVFFVCITTTIASSIASSDAVSLRNWSKALKASLFAVLIGIPGVLIGLIAIGLVQQAVLGDWEPPGGELSFALVLWRSSMWVMFGFVIALPPGLLLRSAKRLWIGVLGGAIGGLVGGILFDVVNVATGTASVSRLLGTMALSMGAVVATNLIEGAVKSGWLHVRAGLIAGKQFILYRNPTLIGSSPQCQIYLFKDTQIAPQHAAIHVLPGRFEIESRDAGRPTYVNGQAVSRQRLKSGDQVQIGSTTFEFQEKQSQTTRG